MGFLAKLGLKKPEKERTLPSVSDVLGSLLKDLEDLKTNNYKRRSDIRDLIIIRVSDLGRIREATPHSNTLYKRLNQIIDPLITIEKFLIGEVKLSEEAIKNFVNDVELRSLGLLDKNK